MFYSRELLSRRGPLGTIWLAGSYLRRLDKRVILQANVVTMCEEVQNPPVPLALPTQSTLLLGVVNIEQRKSKYLLGTSALSPTHPHQRPPHISQRAPHAPLPAPAPADPLCLRWPALTTGVVCGRDGSGGAGSREGV